MTRSSRRGCAVALAASFSLQTAGCYETFDLNAHDIAKLDGYQAPEARLIETHTGRAVVDDRTRLVIEREGIVSERQFASIDVVGTLITTRDREGQFVTFDFRELTRLQTKRYDVGTTLVVAGIAVLASVGVSYMILTLALRNTGRVD